MQSSEKKREILGRIYFVMRLGQWFPILVPISAPELHVLVFSLLWHTRSNESANNKYTPPESTWVCERKTNTRMCFRIRIRVAEPPGWGHMTFHIGPLLWRTRVTSNLNASQQATSRWQKKAKRRFIFFCPFQNSVSLFCEQPDFLYVCVCFFLISLTKSSYL